MCCHLSKIFLYELFGSEQVVLVRDLPQPVSVAINELDAASSVPHCKSQTLSAVVELVVRRTCVRSTNYIGLKRLAARVV
jgi:hypothetical protein